MDEIRSAAAQWLAGVEAWQAILLLSSLAVGSCKKLQWGVRLSLLGGFLAWKGVAWLCSARPVHAGVKAALDAVRDPAAKEMGTDGCPGFEAGRVAVRWNGDGQCWVYMDGDDHTDLFDKAELALVRRAALAEKAKRCKARAQAKAEERLLARQILAESLGAGCECGHGPACKCGPCDCPSKG